MGLIQVDTEKCKRDGICVEVCPLGILGMDEGQGPVVREGMGQFCIACGHCVASCPHGALDNVRAPLAQQAELPEYPVLDPQTASLFLRSRRSVRCYKEDPVPRDKILQLLEIARYAPSGHNSQGISYLIVEDRKALDRIGKIVVEWMNEIVALQPELAKRLSMPGIIKAHKRGEDRILRGAPMLIVASAPEAIRAAPVSTYLALEYVELYATTLGLGTCWAGYTLICAQQYLPLREYLRIADDNVVTGMMMAGYPRYPYYRLPERNPLEVAWFGEEGS